MKLSWSILSLLSLFMANTVFAGPLGEGAVVACLAGSDLNENQSKCINGLDGEPEGTDYLILEFFSLYCGACNANVGQINKLKQNLKENTSIRYISLGKEFHAKKFADKHQLSFPVILDEDEAIQKTFGVIEAPQLYVIDRSNQIIYSHVGLLKNSDIQEIVDLTK